MASGLGSLCRPPVRDLKNSGFLFEGLGFRVQGLGFRDSNMRRLSKGIPIPGNILNRPKP